MERLTEIADKYMTDKGTKFREGHSYTEFYENYISKYIGKHPKILEIGIDTGASLKMWNEYFNEDCEIYAIDILNKSQYNAENIHTFICDQGSREQLTDFKNKINNEKFDIILDDGSHQTVHQWISLAYLFDLVKDDGMYILEDLHMNFYRYCNNNDNFNTPLYCLPFRLPTKHLTHEENVRLMNAIDTVNIWCYHNLKGTYNNQSITSIIKFKH